MHQKMKKGLDRDSIRSLCCTITSTTSSNVAVVWELCNGACRDLNFRSGVYRQRELRDEHELREEQELSFQSGVYLQSELRDEHEPEDTLDNCPTQGQLSKAAGLRGTLSTP